MTGIDMLHVPYKGTSPAMVDLLAGRVTAMFDQIATALPHIRSGKLVAIGVTTARRAPVAPEIPTLAESGAPGFDATTWHGLFAPAGTPREIISRLNAEVVKALGNAELIERFKANGVDPYRYLAALFTALPNAQSADDYEALMPWRIALAER